MATSAAFTASPKRKRESYNFSRMKKGQAINVTTDNVGSVRAAASSFAKRNNGFAFHVEATLTGCRVYRL